jgi:hypothetical protein
MYIYAHVCVYAYIVCNTRSDNTFLQQYDIFIQNACCIHTSKVQATNEVFHITIVL